MKNKWNYYIQLLEVFTYREIKARYRASILGPMWIVIYPLLTATILSIVFGQFIRIKTGNVSYFLFLLSGLVYWNFFQQAITLAKDSLVWNRDLIVKTAFPREVLPLSLVLSKLPDFFVYLTILFFLYFLNGYEFNLLLFMVIIPLIPLILFSTGIALIASLANAVFRDFGRLIEFFLMILFYITPIVYSPGDIPAKYKSIILINPLSLMITFNRSILFDHYFQWDYLLLSIFTSCIIFVFGVVFYKKYGRNIADLI